MIGIEHNLIGLESSKNSYTGIYLPSPFCFSKKKFFFFFIKKFHP